MICRQLPALYGWQKNLVRPEEVRAKLLTYSSNDPGQETCWRYNLLILALQRYIFSVGEQIVGKKFYICYYFTNDTGLYDKQ